MRTTITFDDDVAAEIERLRRRDGLRPSEVVNRLVRQGLARRPPAARYEHRSADIGLTVDVTNVGQMVDLLDES